ncbi:hypothetical protein H257_07333 [Aphanomyces astaci]|uniref:Methyltransferase small domain-containing protein n=1 Tax=Aphanomyces astaci TaxID=112090 RepID=W4GK32_APHAT|nr:hypothetical protein H257_07333 [Aphanomyces astaci]ETV79278.1 hypothetical protein H257_07333 [Aphanomyces astaci]|eukprot:XP_009831119.1 hypothetical protein H257_07333 [Aphanomyces astaci]
MVITSQAQDAPVSLSGLFAASSDSEADEFENEFEIQNISIGDDKYRIRVFSFHEANANKVWPGMFSLADFMDSHVRYSTGRIMELGAATGALAIHLRSSPRNYDVMTSDICDDGAVAANIEFNSILNGQAIGCHYAHTWGTGWAHPGQIRFVIASDILLYVSAYGALVETLLEIFAVNQAEEFLMSWRRRIADSSIFFDLMKAAGFRVHHHGSCIYSFFKPDSTSPYLQSLLLLPPHSLNKQK